MRDTGVGGGNVQAGASEFSVPKFEHAHRLISIASPVGIHSMTVAAGTGMILPV